MELIYNIQIINNTQINIRKNYKQPLKNSVKTAKYNNSDLCKSMI